MIPFTAIIFINSILFAIAFGLNEENSKILLAGYNNMSEEERKKFDIKNYLKFLRNFLIFISIKSTIIFGLMYLIKLQDLQTSRLMESPSTLIFSVMLPHFSQ